MRIQQADLGEFIKQTLLNVRSGIQLARDEGMGAELPDKIDFTVEVVQSAQSLQTATTTESSGTKTATATKPQVVETSARTGGGSTTVETSGGTDTHEATTINEDRSQTITAETSSAHIVGIDSGTDLTETTRRTINQQELVTTTEHGETTQRSSGSGTSNQTNGYQ
jgi:hypothetical protein